MADGLYGEPVQEALGPAAIPDITDFTGVLCFGSAGGAQLGCTTLKQETRARPSDGFRELA